MTGIVHATATNEELFERYMIRLPEIGDFGINIRGMAILTGFSVREIKRGGGDFDRGHARRELAEIKLGREVDMFDVLRLFGDEDAAAGRLDEGGGRDV